MKYILLADIHFGNKGNSDEFNQQCLDFLSFVEDSTKDLDIDGAIFLGDWYHNRNNINVKTLNYGTEGIYTLGNIGRGNVYMILGNHDLYYRDRRDVNSIVIPEGDIGINLITEPLMIPETKMLLVPWLINDESLPTLIKQFMPEYVFGHFEIPSFSFNKLSKMDGEYDPQDYSGPKRILSGHFHLRQEKNNITYIGNCFSHDFSDVNDWHNKGYAILDTDTNEITYYEWNDAPKYCSQRLTKLNEIEIGTNLHLKLVNDTDMKPVELTNIKEQLMNFPQVVDVMIYPKELTETVERETVQIDNIENINDLIIKLLSDMDTKDIDSQKLVSIYKELEI